MKKRIICAIILVLCTVVLLGCTTTTATETKPEQANNSSQQEEIVAGMEYLGYSVDNKFAQFYYYRDTITDVVYVWARDKSGYAGMGGLTVMLDPETGLPLTLTRWKELYNKSNTHTE